MVKWIKNTGKMGGVQTDVISSFWVQDGARWSSFGFDGTWIVVSLVQSINFLLVFLSILLFITSRRFTNKPQTVSGTLFSAGETLLSVTRLNSHRQRKGACTNRVGQSRVLGSRIMLGWYRMILEMGRGRIART